MTLNEALTTRLRQRWLMGQRLSRRRQIEISADGAATLRLGWLWCNNHGLQPATIDNAPDVDLARVPAGVSVLVWSSPDDTEDTIDPPPTPAEIAHAAVQLGSRHIERHQCDDWTTYHLVRR